MLRDKAPFLFFSLTSSLRFPTTQNYIQHVSIKEDPEAKNDPLSLSKRLIIDMGNGREEVYEDLDEILARFVSPMADIVRSMPHAKFFIKDSDRHLVGAKLVEEKNQNPSRVPYAVSPVASEPGRFWLTFVLGRTPKHQVSGLWGKRRHGRRKNCMVILRIDFGFLSTSPQRIRLTPDGLVMAGRTFRRLQDLINWFKLNGKVCEGVQRKIDIHNTLTIRTSLVSLRVPAVVAAAGGEPRPA